jgi:transcriptional regulator with XRE-family HTH domain
MTYEELIKKVLNGKSVNARAKELGMPQKTLDNYVRGKSAPGCGVTMMLAEVAGVPLAEAVAAVAEQEKKARPNHTATFLRPAMASVLMAIAVIVNFFLTPQNAEAAPRLALSPIAQGQDFVLCKITS